MNTDLHFSSAYESWVTPQDIFVTLNSEFSFKLDAAADKDNAKCENYFTKAQDSLSQNWSKYGSVFVNPPYGAGIGAWFRKSVIEARKGAVVVMLVPARTDTAYWHAYAMKYAREIRFVRGRLKFS